MGYSFPLAARVILYASSHRQHNTYHDVCYTSREALAGTRNKPRYVTDNDIDISEFNLYGVSFHVFCMSHAWVIVYVKEGRKEMFYLTTHSTHFIYGYMASDIW